MQVIFWALVLGALGGVIATLYGYGLSGVIKLVWDVIPGLIVDYDNNTMFGVLPSWLYIVFAPIIMGLIVGLLLRFMPLPCGGVPDMLSKIHSRGYIGPIHFLPMLIITLINIPAGGSAGPEAPVLILVGSLAGWLVKYLGITTRSRRVLSLCAMGSGLSAFFGLPMGGAIFVLELPHRMGLQFYEALAPAICSSLMGVFVAKTITGEPFQARYNFRSGGYNIPDYTAVDFLIAAAIGAVPCCSCLRIGFRSGED